jgi:hypothetical protein
MLFVVAHEPLPGASTPQERTLRLAAEAARHTGLPVVRLPFPFPEPSLCLPDSLPGDLAVYSGPIPAREHYRLLEQALAERGAALLNPASASEQVTSIEHWAPLLHDLTPKTVIMRAPSDLEVAGALGFPIFVRGLVKSAKERGEGACFLPDAESLAARAQAAWGRGQVLAARKAVRLRPLGREVMGFPTSREYRLMVLDGEVVGEGFYWGGRDPYGSPTDREREAMGFLARESSRRLEARLLAVDVGESLASGWLVVEAGDAQHTGLGHVPVHEFWERLKQRLG